MNQPPQGQAAATQNRIPMYRPEHMRNMSILTDAERDKYEKGLRTLYEAMEKFGPETANHQAARNKILEFSRMVFNKVQSQRRNQQAQQQAAAGAQPGQQVGGQPPSAAAAMVSAQRAALAAQRPAGVPGAPGNPAPGAGINGAGAPAAGTAVAPGQPTQATPPRAPEHILNHVNQFQIQAPLQIAAASKESAQKWVTEMKGKYTRALIIMEMSTNKIKHIENVIKDRESKGNPVAGDELKRLMDARENEQKQHGDASRFVTGLRKQQDGIKAASQAALQQSGAAPGQNQQPRPQLNSGAANNAISNQAMHTATSSVTAAMDAAKNQQLAAAAAANRQQPAQQMPQTPTTQGAPGAAQTSAPAAQSHTTTAPQAQVKIEPGSHPHPPPVNTALAAASNGHMPSAGTPTQNSAARVQTPQTATPITATGGAKPLSHSAALSLANRQNSSSVPIPTMPNQAGAAGINTTPGSGAIPGSATQMGHSHAHPTQTPALQQSKMPIPKVLPESTTKIPQPVAPGGGVQPGRPTMSGGTGIAGGGLSQPAINKTPALHLQSEGEHVIKKKKLDELVRQVCGGGKPGLDGNYLTPDVEESVLNVADNFVDEVIHAACRMAKARGSKVLEIRDLQLVLERTYNIRIPGYTTDELRTVRKIQPSAGWIGKMSAIQAAKIAPGKDDK